MSQNVPQGLELLVRKAAFDPAFRAALLDDPESAAASSGLELGNAEMAILLAVPRYQLRAMIDSVKTQWQRENRSDVRFHCGGGVRPE